MGFGPAKQTTKEVTPPPRLPDDSSSSIDGDNSVPWAVPMPAPASPAPAHPSVLAPALKLLADLEEKAAGKDRRLKRKFLADVKYAGKFRSLLMLLQDFAEHGLHPGLITDAEKVFQDHPDLLVAFNTFLLP